MVKRLFDLVCSLAGLIILSPLFLFVAFLIKLDSPGGVFYRGLRVGKGGHPFHIFKFRTMTADAATRGPGITTGDDLRITRIGRILRKTKIDELPQLINVVKGEMSLVGPRPEDPRYVALYTPEQRKVLALCPGITSPASLQYRHEEALLKGDDWEKTYLETILARKLEIELAYLERRTFLTDIQLIARTLLALFR
jgi:lipopolysaccharide/colanic/teichoic acid biosynthesis glycosyltransferase